MKKLIQILFFVAVPLNFFAQKVVKDSSFFKRKLSIDVGYAPQKFLSLANGEKKGQSTLFNLNIGTFINKNTLLKIGFIHRSFIYGQTYYGFVPNQNQCFSCLINRNEKKYFVGIPLTIEHHLVGKKMSLWFGYGWQLNFNYRNYIHKKISIPYNNTAPPISDRITNDYPAFNGTALYWAASGNLKLNYNLKKHFSIYIAPTLFVLGNLKSATNINASNIIMGINYLYSNNKKSYHYPKRNLNDTLKNIGKGRIEIGFSFAPNFSYRKITNNHTYIYFVNSRGFSGTTIQYNNSNKFETPKWGQEFGLNLRINLNKHFFVSSGLYRQTIKYKTKGPNLIFSTFSDITCSNCSHTDTSYASKFTFTYKYLSFPILYGFKKNLGKFLSAHVSIGGAVNYFQKGEIDIKNLNRGPSTSDNLLLSSEDNRVIYFQEREDSMRYSLWGVINTGLDISLNNRWIFSVDPAFRYSITHFNRDYWSFTGLIKNKMYLYSVALNFSLFYKIP